MSIFTKFLGFFKISPVSPHSDNRDLPVKLTAKSLMLKAIDEHYGANGLSYHDRVLPDYIVVEILTFADLPTILRFGYTSKAALANALISADRLSRQILLREHPMEHVPETIIDPTTRNIISDNRLAGFNKLRNLRDSVTIENWGNVIELENRKDSLRGVVFSLNPFQLALSFKMMNFIENSISEESSITSALMKRLAPFRKDCFFEKRYKGVICEEVFKIINQCSNLRLMHLESLSSSEASNGILNLRRFRNLESYHYVTKVQSCDFETHFKSFPILIRKYLKSFHVKLENNSFSETSPFGRNCKNILTEEQKVKIFQGIVNLLNSSKNYNLDEIMIERGISLLSESFELFFNDCERIFQEQIDGSEYSIQLKNKVLDSYPKYLEFEVTRSNGKKVNVKILTVDGENIFY